MLDPPGGLWGPKLTSNPALADLLNNVTSSGSSSKPIKAMSLTDLNAEVRAIERRLQAEQMESLLNAPLNPQTSLSNPSNKSITSLLSSFNNPEPSHDHPSNVHLTHAQSNFTSSSPSNSILSSPNPQGSSPVKPKNTSSNRSSSRDRNSARSITRSPSPSWLPTSHNKIDTPRSARPPTPTQSPQPKTKAPTKHHHEKAEKSQMQYKLEGRRTPLSRTTPTRRERNSSQGPHERKPLNQSHHVHNEGPSKIEAEYQHQITDLQNQNDQLRQNFMTSQKRISDLEKEVSYIKDQQKDVRLQFSEFCATLTQQFQKLQSQLELQYQHQSQQHHINTSLQQLQQLLGNTGMSMILPNSNNATGPLAPPDKRPEQ